LRNPPGRPRRDTSHRPGDRGDRAHRRSPSRDRLAVDVPADRAPYAGAGSRPDPLMRFQAAAPDARAIVYAGIQADPLVARMADLLASATPALLLLARAAVNGDRT